MQYMPDPGTDNKMPDRLYFWNVAHTVQKSYV